MYSAMSKLGQNELRILLATANAVFDYLSGIQFILSLEIQVVHSEPEFK